MLTNATPFPPAGRTVFANSAVVLGQPMWAAGVRAPHY
jgi:hypothetical protein